MKRFAVAFVAITVGVWGLIFGAAQVATATGDKVTICHVPQGNPENAHTITISKHALKAHLNKDGTLHGGDYYGECKPVEEPPPVDECPNIEGDQSEVPAGYEVDEHGNCVLIPEVPVDVCPNIEGDQSEIPAGQVKDDEGNCVTPEVPEEPPVEEPEEPETPVTPEEPEVPSTEQSCTATKCVTTDSSGKVVKVVEYGNDVREEGL